MNFAKSLEAGVLLLAASMLAKERDNSLDEGSQLPEGLLEVILCRTG